MAHSMARTPQTVNVTTGGCFGKNSSGAQNSIDKTTQVGQTYAAQQQH